MNVKVNYSPAANQFNTPVKSAAAKSKPDGSFLNVGDQTTRVGKQDMDTFTERLAEAFRTDNAEVIRALDELSASDKMEIAMRSYLQMQGRVLSAKSKEESDIKEFNALEGEKAYYKGLLEDAKSTGLAKIGDDRYNHGVFSDLKPGDNVTSRDIEGALEDVQGRIDKFLYPKGKYEDGTAVPVFENERMTREYIGYAEAFREVTGYEADCLDPGDSLLLHKPDRTEENFLAKAHENIDTLNTMSKELGELIKRYRDEQETEIGGGDLSEEARTRMEAFSYVLNQFTLGDQSAELKTLGILNTQA